MTTDAQQKRTRYHGIIGLLGTAALFALGCDDTTTAVKERSREEAAQAEQAATRAAREAEEKAKQVKQDIDRAAKEAKRAAERAGERTREAVDRADKAVADEIRGDEPKK